MKCTQPLYAADLGVINPDTGHRRIKILPRRIGVDFNLQDLEMKYGQGKVLSLPCGKCINCRINYARTWALRCVAEAFYYDENWFVTLTYDDENYSHRDCKKDFQDFMKRLRKKHPGVRYFMCCEAGDQTHRYHMHAILFNLHLSDVKCLGKGPKAGYYYESKDLLNTWSKGFIVLGDVNYTTCNYVAQYCLKKTYKETEGEFVQMSLKPGIGTQYFKDHWESIYDTDKVYLANGNTYVNNPSRYFDKLLDRIHPLLLDDIKQERISKANAYRFDKLIKFNMEYDEQVLQLDERASINNLNDKLKKRRF